MSDGDAPTVQPLDSRRALVAASRLVSLGFPVIWLRSPAQAARRTPKGDVILPPERRGKAPVAEGWASQDALAHEDLASMWGQGEPGYNVGIRTGRVAGARTCVVVVDLDSPQAVAWAEENLPETQVKVRTAKGQHWYYLCPPMRVGNRVRVRVGDEVLALDVKGDGGLVVGPASVHGTGHIYRGLLPWTPERVDSMPLFDPAWFGEGAEWEGDEDPRVAEGAERRPPLYAPLESRRKRARAYLEHTPGTVSGQGTASADCLYYARALVFGLCLPPEEAARLMAQHEWNSRCTSAEGEPYPWDMEELLHKCRDAYRLRFDKPYGWLLSEGREAAPEPAPDAEAEAARQLGEVVADEAEREAAGVGWDFAVEEQDVEDAGRRGWPLTDTGNAERLVARFGESVRHVEDRGAWMAWDASSGRWLPRLVALDRCSKVTARRIADEFGAAEERAAALQARVLDMGEGDAGLAEAKAEAEAAAKALDCLRGWQKRSESIGARRAMVQLAASEPTIAVGSDAFDRHPFLLNVKNGVLDLRLGARTVLRPHDRDLYLTKSALVAWDERADYPTWRRCLRQWMGGNDELVQFLQRVAGYMLTGSVECECMFIFCGGGQNGKSTFLNALASVLGPYSQTAPAGLLMETRQDKATPSQQAGLASLVGCRLVVASETDDSAHLSEAQVKATTCRDRISAKRMYEGPFDFAPTHKVALTTNHKPTISGTDEGIWRRVVLVEWLHQVAAEDRDDRLAERLLAEREGILRWAVEGARLWQASGGGYAGLKIPAEVAGSLRKYREEQDTMGAFMSDCVEVSPQTVVTAAVLREAYVAWCDELGHKPFGAKRFAQELVKRGAEARRTAAARIWIGVRLKDGK